MGIFAVGGIRSRVCIIGMNIYCLNHGLSLRLSIQLPSQRAYVSLAAVIFDAINVTLCEVLLLGWPSKSYLVGQVKVISLERTLSESYNITFGDIIMSQEDSNTVTRRRLLAWLGGTSTATIGGYWLLMRSVEPVLAATIVADNVSIETANGQISDVSISPSVTIGWENLNSNADTVDFTFSASSEQVQANSFEPILTRIDLNIPADQKNSAGTASFSTADGSFVKSSVLAHSKIATADFEDTTEDGSPKVTTVTIQVEVAIKNAEGTTIATTSSTDDFTVSVNNLNATVTVSGKAGTSVQA